MNWEKYNSRKVKEKTSWFRMENSLFENPDLFDFTHTDFVVLMYLLSICSKKQSGVIDVNISHMERVGRIKEKDFRATLGKLGQVGFARDCDTDDTSTSHDCNTHVTLRNETDVTRRDETDDNARTVFDFESLYQKYPRKEGKTRGIKIAEREIRTPEEYDLLSSAVDRYAKYCEAQGTEGKYIKHFATFMGCWREWLDPATGTTSGRKYRGIADILAEGDVA
jgi:hypothetical protein